MQKRLKTVKRIYVGSMLALIVGVGLIHISGPSISDNAKILQVMLVYCSLSVAVCSLFAWGLIILHDKLFKYIERLKQKGKIDDKFYEKIKKIIT